jgi:hypothetical protein
MRRWTQAKTGSGKVVLISSEPVVGKSRLAEALASQIAAEPHIRLRYFCSLHHQDSALYPVIAQMERAASFVHGETRSGGQAGQTPGTAGHHRPARRRRGADREPARAAQSLTRSAMAEAVTQMRNGLDIVTTLPDTTWRRQQELDLQVALGSALTATKGWSSATVGEALTRSRALAEQLDRSDHLVLLTATQWGFRCVQAESGRTDIPFRIAGVPLRDMIFHRLAV